MDITQTDEATLDRNLDKGVSAAVPVALFQGYNSVLGKGCSMAVEGEYETTGGKAEITCSVCTSLSELAQSLEINQSFSLDIKGIASVNQKMSLLNSLKVSSYSTSIVVHARRIQSTKTATETKLKKNIKAPINDNEKKDFFRTYGDSFLDSVTYGGEYFAVYVFHSESREEQKKLEVSLNASGIYGSVSVDASFQMKLNNLIKNSKTQYSFRQMVSGISKTTLPTPDKIVDYALKFSSLDLDAPIVISFTSEGYEHIGGFGDFQPIKKNRDYFIGISFNEGLLAKFAKITEILNQISSIKSIYDHFGAFSDKELDSTDNAFLQAKEAVIQQVNNFNEDPIRTFSTPPLPALDKVPTISYQFHTSPTWGGMGGAPSGVDIATWGELRPQLVGIQLRTGARVDKLMLTYRDKLGKEELKELGGNGGTMGNKFSLQAGERITCISGRSGSRLDNVTFRTNINNSVGGGGMGGGAFNFDVPSGQYVIGLNLRSGAEIDQLQVVTLSFSPAKWVKL